MFLNWKKTSSSMVADGVVDDILKSIKMHGLKFYRIIGKNIFVDIIYTYNF